MGYCALGLEQGLTIILIFQIADHKNHINPGSMSDHFLTYQKFNDMALAQDMKDWLQQHGIESRLENNQKYFNPDFAFNRLDADILIKLRAGDFEKANQALDDYFRKQLNNVAPDYYLFQFSNAELKEIISKPDEWGHLDYQLAQKILKERGDEINPGMISELKEERLEELARPEKSPSAWIWSGYFFALFTGFIGAFIGSLLAFSKRTLPDGQRVYSYPPGDRLHGRIIFFIGLAVTLISFFEKTMLWIPAFLNL